MKSREELLQEFGGNPQRWADYAMELQQQLAEAKNNASAPSHAAVAPCRRWSWRSRPSF